MAETAASYADPVVFLFLGGFLVALAIECWGLHRRIALNVLNVLGTLFLTLMTSLWLPVAWNV